MKDNEKEVSAEIYATADPVELPENAFRELGADEHYRPIMHPAHDYKEVTPYSVGMGLLLAVIFSAAAAYLGLRVGQVFEAAIPIAIIAVGLSSALKKDGALGQNVIIQSIGACSGVIVAGAIFTLPSLFILQSSYPDITVDFLEIFLSSLLGGVLGILFFIPFRKYFVKDMHGKYPFPEATATTQVLDSGHRRSLRLYRVDIRLLGRAGIHRILRVGNRSCRQIQDRSELQHRRRPAWPRIHRRS